MSNLIDTELLEQFGEELPVFSGATESNAGIRGFVPAPSAGDQDKFLKGDGTWGEGGGGEIAQIAINTNGSTSEIAYANRNSIGIGYNANSKNESIAIGNITSSNNNSIAIGYNAIAKGINSISIGLNSVAGEVLSTGYVGQASVSIGVNSSSQVQSISVGNNSLSKAQCVSVGDSAKSYDGGTAIGQYSNAYGANAISIGVQSNARGTDCISIGTFTKCIGANGSVAIGFRSNAITDSISIGTSSYTKNNSIGIGINTNVDSSYSIGIGYNGVIKNTISSIAIGYNSRINGSSTSTGDSNILIGTDSEINGVHNSIGIMLNGGTITKNYAIGIGDKVEVNAMLGIAIGYTANIPNGLGMNGIAIGSGATVNFNNSIAIGHGAKCMYGTDANSSISIGDGASTVALGATAIGYSAYCSGLHSTAIGYNTQNEVDYSIQLGGSDLTSIRSKVTSITSSSDERDKADIEKLDSALEFLNEIDPIIYVRNYRDMYNLPDEELSEEDLRKRHKYGLYGYDKEAHAAGTKKGERRRAGVIAQNVLSAMKNIYNDDSYANLVDDNLHNFKDVPDDVENQLGVNYTNFIPFLIRAIQELSEKIDKLEAEKEA